MLTQIQVRVMNAVGLRAVNLIKGNSDPYAVVSVDRTGEQKTTTVCLNTVNPQWYHNLVFTDVSESDILTIRLYDKNYLSGDIDLGVVHIPIGEALSISTAILHDHSYSLHSPPPPPPPPRGHLRQHTSQPAYYSDPPPSAEGLDPFEPSAPPPSPPATSLDGKFVNSATFGPSLYPSPDAYQAATARYQPSHPNAPPPVQSYGSQSQASVGRRSTTSSSSRSHRAVGTADVHLQRSMTRSYQVSRKGSINVIIAPGTVANMGKSVPRNHFKRFQTHKFAEQVGNIGKISMQNRVGHTLGNIVKTGVDLAKPLHPAVDLFQPVNHVFQEHSTWKIDMREVRQVFGSKRHGWNRKYPAAQKIFQGSGSVVARKLVQMQHAYLYGGGSGIKPIVNARKDLLEITGNTIDAQDFLNLMEYGIRRGKPRMFTYVLMPDKLYMAETGAEFFRDMMSKHAMHCSASPEVVYAGELHFRRAPLGSNEPTIRLIVDNNSGTYAPGKEDLPKIEEVFRRNFPGLAVTALDFRDPVLKAYTDVIRATSSADQIQAGPGKSSHCR